MSTPPQNEDDSWVPSTPKYGTRFDFPSDLDMELKSATKTNLSKPARSRTRTRTRTISGAQLGGPMMTPRETPYKNRKNKTKIEGGSTARVLFASDSVGDVSVTGNDIGAGMTSDSRTSQKQEHGLKILESPESPLNFDGVYRPRVERGSKDRSSKSFEIYKDYDDDVFSSKSNTPQKRANHELTHPPTKKGMMFVFRGKRIFRPFPQEEDEDEDLSISPIKPRILFPKKSELELQCPSQSPSQSQSQSQSSSSPSSSSSIDAGHLGKSKLLQQKLGVDLQNSASINHGPETKLNLISVEEEETDIEDY
ncbi:uncharacterized protein V1516DRAFT_673807 [Lipomyces oligophaga]|uniref:uncharacterized protein n=1 Tax=Lipomyces oligophaga TaxID=45792 RepID=UPI0034CE4171